MDEELDIRNAADLYAMIGIDPFASPTEISDGIADLNNQLSQLPDDEKVARLQELQRLTNILNDPVRRVQLNAILPERIDAKTVDYFLSAAGTISMSELTVPEPSIADVYTDGSSRELMTPELEAPVPIEDLELDFNELNTILSTSMKDRELFFDS